MVFSTTAPSHDVFPTIEVTHTQEVVVINDSISLEAYRETCSATEYDLLLDLANQFKGKKLVFISATPQGGGVALMRHALIRLFRLLDVDAQWYVLKPKPEAFLITKTKFHNVLQSAVDSSVRLTPADEEVYTQWMAENAQVLSPVFASADVVVIDDPQPTGLIPHIKQINPNTKIIYRSHIHIEAALADQPGTSQYYTWQFLWQFIQQTDCFVSHPVLDFVPQTVPKEKLVFMTATTDPLDGLNQPLSEAEMEEYLTMFNTVLAAEQQSPLDIARPFLVQIARFDPAKGIPDVIQAYSTLVHLLEQRALPRPQLVIAGNSSIDDPDRDPIFDMVVDLINSDQYRHLKDDIKVARLPHVDELLNTLLRKSMIVLQLSTKEGFEVKVTEALMKGKPVVAYNSGGIPLQIEDGVNGFLVDTGNTNEVAHRLFSLLTNQQLYRNMSEAATQSGGKKFLTVPNAINWLTLALKMLHDTTTVVLR